MPERRAPRLILEVAFLGALAAALTFADLEPYQVAGVMLFGWLLVAVFEWGALRVRPHFGSGSPPRWYTPPVKLPPPRPLEQFSAGYPAAEAVSDAPTWIASPAMLAEWPVAEVESEAGSVVDEQTDEHDVFEEERVVAEPGEDTQAEGPEFEEEFEEEELAEPEPPKPQRRVEARPARAGERMARHRIDPLAASSAKGRRFGRRGEAVIGDLDVPDGPPRRRLLPAQARSED